MGEGEGEGDGTARTVVDRLRSAVLVTSHPGQAPVAELEADAATGRRPRKDYVELAKALDADVIDHSFIAANGHRLSRTLARRSFPVAQVTEAFLRRGTYRRVVAWADRLGLPLALAHKLARSRRDVVVISVWLTVPKKRVFIERLRVHTHIGALITPSSIQRDIAVNEFGVPADKVHHVGQRVDHRFWTPGSPRRAVADGSPVVCAAGWEARDYATMVEAVSTLAVRAELAVGTFVLSPSASGGNDAVFEALRGTTGYDNYRRWTASAGRAGAGPGNVTIRPQLAPTDLRELYRSARVVVIPLHDVDTDCGATALAEAMSMAKPVVVTQTRGQVDIMRDREHGFYVPPGDPRSMRQAIQHLLDNPEEAARMGRAGREHVERHHTLDGYVARVVEITEATGDG